MKVKISLSYSIKESTSSNEPGGGGEGGKGVIPVDILVETLTNRW